MTSSSQSEWLTVTDLADELKVPVRTIYAWRSTGRGPAGVLLGKHLRFRRSEVERWIEARVAASGGDAA